MKKNISFEINEMSCAGVEFIWYVSRIIFKYLNILLHYNEKMYHFITYKKVSSVAQCKNKFECCSVFVYSLNLNKENNICIKYHQNSLIFNYSYTYKRWKQIRKYPLENLHIGELKFLIKPNLITNFSLFNTNFIHQI